jgi:hypothetical protein
MCSHDFDCVQRHTSSRVKNWAQALTRRQKRFQSSLDHGTIAGMSALIAPMTLRHLRAAAATSNHAKPAIYLPPPRRSQMGASAHLMILAAHLRVARLAQSSPLMRRPHAPDALRARRCAISSHTAPPPAESAAQRRRTHHNTGLAKCSHFRAAGQLRHRHASPLGALIQPPPIPAGARRAGQAYPEMGASMDAAGAQERPRRPLRTKLSSSAPRPSGHPARARPRAIRATHTR